jgi:acyl-CoA thioesterase I
MTTQNFDIERNNLADHAQPSKPRRTAIIGLIISFVIVVVIYQLQEVMLRGNSRGNFLVQKANKLNISHAPHNIAHREPVSACPIDINGTVVLAFGDSLTDGFPVNHPYGKHVLSLFHCVNVVIEGVVGEMTGSMLSRFKEEMEKSKPTVAVILGGTNDILRRVPVDEIISNIISLHDYAQTWSRENQNVLTHTIAMTVPDIYGEKFDELRFAVNRGLRTYASKSNGFVGVVELESYFNKSLAENAVYWHDDGLHFSVVGYDAVGTLVHTALCSFK